MLTIKIEGEERSGKTAMLKYLYFLLKEKGFNIDFSLPDIEKSKQIEWHNILKKPFTGEFNVKRNVITLEDNKDKVK